VGAGTADRDKGYQTAMRLAAPFGCRPRIDQQCLDLRRTHVHPGHSAMRWPDQETRGSGHGRHGCTGDGRAGRRGRWRRTTRASGLHRRPEGRPSDPAISRWQLSPRGTCRHRPDPHRGCFNGGTVIVTSPSSATETVIGSSCPGERPAHQQPRPDTRATSCHHVSLVTPDALIPSVSASSGADPALGVPGRLCRVRQTGKGST
jgi:hypothetical protein